MDGGYVVTLQHGRTGVLLSFYSPGEPPAADAELRVLQRLAHDMTE